MDSYRDLPSWEKYRNILKSEFHLEITRDPVEHWETIGGHEVHIDVWSACFDVATTLADQAIPGTVILVHGGGGNGRILAPFAQAVAELGWRVLVPDLPGFGITRPAADWRGDYAAWPAVIAELGDRQHGPVVLIGASMGGMTAVYAAQSMRSAPLCVVATTLLDLSDAGTFVRSARSQVLGWLSLLSTRLAPWIMDRLSLPLNVVAPLSAMSANSQMAKYFRTDPLIGAKWVPLKFWRTAHAFLPKHFELPCPLTLLHPGADEWTLPAESEKTYNKISSEKRFVLLPTGSHLPMEPDAFAALLLEIGSVLSPPTRRC